MKGPIKRSMMIAGHATSISLEPLFWEALREAAAEEGLPLSALVARIDAERVEADEPPNLGSAIRVWLFGRARGKQSSPSKLGEGGGGAERSEE
jgi:predicted DNA-binding ribbon-helix-helix protein